MLLTITTTHQPATDLGYLLHKHPEKVQTFDLTFGKAHVFYPEVSEHSCTAALLLDIDPIGLVRKSGPAGDRFALQQYVNDRPYVASSFMSVAISEIFGTALSGKSRERAELVNTRLPFVARLSALPIRGGAEPIREMFEPLGYQVTVKSRMLSEKFPEWGESSCHEVELKADVTLHDLLTHLYVLVPALDGEKHYWIGEDEVQKLLRHGAGWLSTHPNKTRIVERYLKRQVRLTRQALAQLLEDDPADDQPSEPQEKTEREQTLNQQRHGAVHTALRESGARSVLDLGCNTGNLLRLLLSDKQFEKLTGVDVSYRTLEIAADKLHLDRMSEIQRKRISLVHGSLIYRDERLAGYDAAAVVEVIEHLDAARRVAFERVLFEHARPRTIVLTTPNFEYNVRYETLQPGRLRHWDHRFEWTRAQFQEWATSVAQRFGYSVRILPVGNEDLEVGAPTQMAIFTLGVP